VYTRAYNGSGSANDHSSSTTAATTMSVTSASGCLPPTSSTVTISCQVSVTPATGERGWLPCTQKCCSTQNQPDFCRVAQATKIQ
jgi:hypothetical protein